MQLMQQLRCSPVLSSLSSTHFCVASLLLSSTECVFSGRSFCITSHKMLTMCIDTIIQKVQQNGALIQFEKFGPDPAPPLSGKGRGHFPLLNSAYLSWFFVFSC